MNMHLQQWILFNIYASISVYYLLMELNYFHNLNLSDYQFWSFVLLTPVFNYLFCLPSTFICKAKKRTIASRQSTPYASQTFEDLQYSQTESQQSLSFNGMSIE